MLKKFLQVKVKGFYKARKKACKSINIKSMKLKYKCKYTEKYKIIYYSNGGKIQHLAQKLKEKSIK